MSAYKLKHCLRYANISALSRRVISEFHKVNICLRVIRCLGRVWHVSYWMCRFLPPAFPKSNGETPKSNEEQFDHDAFCFET